MIAIGYVIIVERVRPVRLALRTQRRERARNDGV